MPTTAPATASSGFSNLLLAMLDATSLSLLEPHLRDITLKQYDILQDAEATTRGRYFEATDQPPNPSMARARSGCGGHLAQLVVDGGSQGGNQAKAINLSRGRHRL